MKKKRKNCLYGRLPTIAEVKKYERRRADGYRIGNYLYSVYDPRNTRDEELTKMNAYCDQFDWSQGVRNTLRHAIVDLHGDECRRDDIRSDLLELTIRDLFTVSPMKTADLLRTLRRVFPDLTSRDLARKLEKLEKVGVIHRIK